MRQYPESIAPPGSIEEARIERRQHLLYAIKWGVSLRLFIILGELLGFFLFGSYSILMDALSSLIDVFCSLFLFLFIKLAERPPDENHPFGHGRYEPLAGLQLGLLLAIVGGGMLIQQATQLTTMPGEFVLDRRLWIIPLAALVLLEICYQVAKRIAEKHDSPAIAADAAHYRIDSLTSLFATISLGVAALFPEWSHLIDHVGAMAIAIMMMILGLFSAKSNLNQLLDRVPDERYFKVVRQAARNVPGILDTEKIRIQLYGPDAHVDIDVEVDPLLSVEEAHKISQKVRVAIQKDWPMVRDVTVHLEPYYPNDH